MSEFLFDYNPVHPTTWAYLSSLLMLCVFFKFGRFWSVRNLDLVLLILLAPGLLLVLGNQYNQHGSRPAADQEVALAESAAAAGGVEQPVERASPNGGDEARLLAVAPQPLTPERPPTASESPVAATAPAPQVEPDAPAPAVAPPETAPGGDGTEPPGSAADDTASPDTAQLGNAAADGKTADAENVPVAEVAAAGAGENNYEFVGYIWLLLVAAFFVVRLLLDPTMVRRPLLEPNLSAGGLSFMGISLFIFLMANVVSSHATDEDLAGPRSAEHLLAGVADQQDADNLRRQGPGNAVVHLFPNLVTNPLVWSDAAAEKKEREVAYVRTAKTMAILSHLAVVVGMVIIGYSHFGNIKMGIGAATLYLMLPYTAMMTGRVLHVLPAALLVWMVLSYRRPLWAGMFMGLAVGVVYYPLFLLPLWISFYWQRGLWRFLVGVLVTLTVSVVSLVFVSVSMTDYLENVQRLFGIWLPVMQDLQGVWGLGWDPIFRLPVLAGFVAISGALAIWPAQKNLGTLLSCSAAVMVATQFWHGYGGGMYLAWYLPLTLLTVFRPNLEDRVALTVLGEGWLPRRRSLTAKAA